MTFHSIDTSSRVHVKGFHEYSIFSPKCINESNNFLTIAQYLIIKIFEFRLYK